MLYRISLAFFGLTFGSILTLVGFIAYAMGNSTLNLVGFFYGIPILLGGLALKAAELKPIPFSKLTSPELVELRENQATPTQNQIRKDVTRFRYGQTAHLDDSLGRLGLSPTDEDRPLLIGIREDQINGLYALILEFDSPFFDLAAWQEKQFKVEKFFGPHVKAEITEPEAQRIDVALIAIPKADLSAIVTEPV